MSIGAGIAASGVWIAVLSAMAISGAILNVYKRREGFALWIFTNSAWTFISLQRQNYSEAAMWGVYLALSLLGFIKWKEAK